MAGATVANWADGGSLQHDGWYCARRRVAGAGIEPAGRTAVVEAHAYKTAISMIGLLDGDGDGDGPGFRPIKSLQNVSCAPPDGTGRHCAIDLRHLGLLACRLD